MMNPGRVQEIFQAMVIHLTSEKYNFFVYNGKTRSQKQTTFAAKLAKKFDNEQEVIDFFVANQIDFFNKNHKVCTWIGHFCNDECIAIWTKYDSYIQNYAYFGKSEAKKLLELGAQLRELHGVYSLMLDDKVTMTTVSNFMVRFKTEKSWETEDPLLAGVLFFLQRIAHFTALNKENFMAAILSAKSEL